MRFIVISILSLLICSMANTSFAQNNFSVHSTDNMMLPSDTMSVSLTIPRVILSNDTVIRIIAAELYSEFDELCPDVDKVISAVYDKKHNAYHFRLVTPMEYGALKIGDADTVSDIIGFSVIEGDMYILLDKSFSDCVNAYDDKFKFDLLVEKEPPYICPYDPWEKVYIVKNGQVYPLGKYDNSQIYDNVVRILLENMKFHSLPRVNVNDSYVIPESIVNRE